MKRFSADLREPHMGTDLPVTVEIYLREGKIVHVVLENEDGYRISATQDVQSLNN
jgi:hypothetical protein